MRKEYHISNGYRYSTHTHTDARIHNNYVTFWYGVILNFRLERDDLSYNEPI